MGFTPTGGGKIFLIEVVVIIKPLPFAAAAEDAEAILDVPGWGIELAGRNGTDVELVLFVIIQVIIKVGADRFDHDKDQAGVLMFIVPEVSAVDGKAGRIGAADGVGGQKYSAKGAVEAADLGIADVWIFCEEIQS